MLAGLPLDFVLFGLTLLCHGWHVALAYVVGILYATLGWHPDEGQKLALDLKTKSLTHQTQ